MTFERSTIASQEKKCKEMVQYLYTFYRIEPTLFKVELLGIPVIGKNKVIASVAPHIHF